MTLSTFFSRTMALSLGLAMLLAAGDSLAAKENRRAPTVEASKKRGRLNPLRLTDRIARTNGWKRAKRFMNEHPKLKTTAKIAATGGIIIVPMLLDPTGQGPQFLSNLGTGLAGWANGVVHVGAMALDWSVGMGKAVVDTAVANAKPLAIYGAGLGTIPAYRYVKGKLKERKARKAAEKLDNKQMKLPFTKSDKAISVDEANDKIKNTGEQFVLDKNDRNPGSSIDKKMVDSAHAVASSLGEMVNRKGQRRIGEQRLGKALAQFRSADAPGNFIAAFDALKNDARNPEKHAEVATKIKKVKGLGDWAAARIINGINGKEVIKHTPKPRKAAAEKKAKGNVKGENTADNAPTPIQNLKKAIGPAVSETIIEKALNAYGRSPKGEKEELAIRGLADGAFNKPHEAFKRLVEADGIGVAYARRVINGLRKDAGLKAVKLGPTKKKAKANTAPAQGVMATRINKAISDLLTSSGMAAVNGENKITRKAREVIKKGTKWALSASLKELSKEMGSDFGGKFLFTAIQNAKKHKGAAK